MTELAPVRREVIVPANAAAAFDVFCTHLGDWWPLGGFGVFGDGTVALHGYQDGGRIVETAADGRTALWGTVTEWDPPNAVAFTWHPGFGAERAGHVRVTFTATGDGSTGATRVTLSHSGWEGYADPAASREMYGTGWPTVLGAYRGRVGVAAG